MVDSSVSSRPYRAFGRALDVYVLLGKLRLGDELIREFYAKSPDKIRGHALHYLGYSLYEKQPIASEILERARSLCDARLAAIGNVADKDPSVRNSRLLAGGSRVHNLTTGGACLTLIEVLGAGLGIEADHLVV